MMQFTFELPTRQLDVNEEFASADAITEITRAAGDAGFGAVNVTDHPAPDGKWLDHGGHHALDPFVALSFAAAAHRGVRLQTNIYVAAYRNPFLGAKSVHSLDLLSEGRVILGVAAGYLRPEFSALGMDFDDRGRLLDDALEVLERVYTGDDVAWDAPGIHARGVRFAPVVRDGRPPPVWVGGNSRTAIRRAARHDGWAPFHTGGFAATTRTSPLESLDDLAAAIAHLRDELLAPDRRDSFDVCWSEALLSRPDASADERCAMVARLHDAGVTWSNVGLGGSTVDEITDAIAAFGREVIAEVG